MVRISNDLVFKRNKVPRWPHRKIKSLDKSIEALERTRAQNPEQEATISAQIEDLKVKRDIVMKYPETIVSGGIGMIGNGPPGPASNLKRKRARHSSQRLQQSQESLLAHLRSNSKRSERVSKRNLQKRFDFRSLSASDYDFNPSEEQTNSMSSEDESMSMSDHEEPHGGEQEDSASNLALAASTEALMHLQASNRGEEVNQMTEDHQEQNQHGLVPVHLSAYRQPIQPQWTPSDSHRTFGYPEYHDQTMMSAMGGHIRRLSSTSNAPGNFFLSSPSFDFGPLVEGSDMAHLLEYDPTFAFLARSRNGSLSGSFSGSISASTTCGSSTVNSVNASAAPSPRTTNEGLSQGSPLPPLQSLSPYHLPSIHQPMYGSPQSMPNQLQHTPTPAPSMHYTPSASGSRSSIQRSFYAHHPPTHEPFPQQWR